ncbi:nucleoporin GLE1-like [Argonauta hians]
METCDVLKNSPKGQLVYKRQTDVRKLLIDLETCTVPALGIIEETLPLPSSYKEEEYEDLTESVSSLDQILPPANKENDKNCTNDGNVQTNKTSPIIPEYFRTKLVIEEYRDWCKNFSKILKKKKSSEFYENDKNLNILEAKNLEYLRKKEEECQFSQWEKLQDLFKQSDEEILKNQKQRSEQYTHHYETIVQKLQETRRKHQEAAEKDREQKLQQLRDDLQKCQTQSDLFSTMVKECAYKKHLPNIDKYEQAIANLNTISSGLMTLAESTGNALPEHFAKAANILTEIQNINKTIKQNIETANQKGKEEEEEALKAQQATPCPEKVSTGQVASPAPAPNPETPEDSEKAQALKVLSEFVDPVIFKEYLRLKNKLNDVEAGLQPFIKNRQLKEYVFSIRKAANTLINAISPVSGNHLKDKLMKLTMLVQGQTIEVSNKDISAKDEPEGITYTIYLIAKMIVKKGAEQVSSSHESAFAIALVAVGLWQNFPEFGELLLANFYISCPYIVPYYIPQQDGQNTEEYHKLLGYKYESGKIEEQEKFLKRMTGIMRLYAAIIISPVPPGTSTPHPHGIKNSWIWITRILNMKPRPDITAAMMYNVLDVTGHSLFTYYQKPFQKLLHILITEFLPKIKAVSASAGSVSRLETFLEANINNKGQIATPYGYLNSSFWLR